MSAVRGERLTPAGSRADTVGVRGFMGMFLLAAAVTGCSPAAAPPSASPNAAAPSPASTGPPPTRTNRVAITPRYPAINPITPVQGRVTFVNDRFRFVIVDFAFHQMPQLEQRLGVYRRDVRIGEVRISGPADGSTIVADIMSGDADLGDQVRED